MLKSVDVFASDEINITLGIITVNTKVNYFSDFYSFGDLPWWYLAENLIHINVITD